MTAPNKILVVEDSPIVSKIIRHVMATDSSFDAHYADSFESARVLYDEIQDDVFAALVDLNLPDAPDGEVVDYLLDLGVPVVVLTGSFDEERRTELVGKGIVDYVTKEGRYSYLYALGMLRQLRENQTTKVLVVEDSATSRNFIVELLRQHQFNVLEAVDGSDAIRVVLENPDIKLLITDYNMPNMDGFELVQALRGKYEKNDMGIIGLSAEGQESMSAKFIKNGANDYLAKPFNHEEFYCRVNHNLDAVRQAENLRRLARIDPLTGVLNRQEFLREAQKLVDQSQEKQQPLALAICDIQQFAMINVHYGLAVGDLVLTYVADILRNNFQRFLIGRASDDGFCLLIPGLGNDKSQALLAGLQATLQQSPLTVGEHKIVVSFNAGVSNRQETDAGLLLLRAEACLRRAKATPTASVFGD